MQRTAIPLFLALALPFASAHAAQQVHTFVLDLDADGHITRLAPHGAVPGAVTDALADEIRAWVFHPGPVDQAGAAARTYLRVVVDDAHGEPGGYSVVSATTGPALAATTAPEYPMRDQLAGHEGMVVLKLEVDAGGNVRAADVHAATGSVSRAMATAAVNASRQWRFATEGVGGASVAATLLWPVCYLGAHSTPEACSWTGPDDQRFSSKTVLPLDPRVTLVSQASR
ncbi:TonB family protein [Luteimonas sp. MC1825]|uniref:TonB family protein n=1 Tax=Luteimonas sp. MC1825 TaxID=2761107 RepID=UPI00160AEF68|nr:TonB family protein [Luteimonas sp. MC1825]MBB6598868.1 TonB family protein [Luteimonas sp. MC1825]QOC89019.1 TonB family protein [Luteimonas sp. MC1825]